MSKNEDTGFIADTPDAIEYVALASAKGQVRLESKGMTNSARRSVRLLMAKKLGMKQNSTHDEVIAMIQHRMDLHLIAKQGGITVAQLDALMAYALKHGKDHWKERLLMSWINGGDHAPELQQLRNQKGPKWLAKVDIDFEVS